MTTSKTPTKNSSTDTDSEKTAAAEKAPAKKTDAAKKPATSGAKKVAPEGKTADKAAAPKKAKPAAAKAESDQPTLSMQELVGLTAGKIWHHLNDNGPTSVSKLIKELAEEDKIVHRALGWLLQEDKLTLEVQNRVETVSLK